MRKRVKSEWIIFKRVERSEWTIFYLVKNNSEAGQEKWTIFFKSIEKSELIFSVDWEKWMNHFQASQE